MSVAQFGNHVGEHLEELVGVHGGINSVGIARTHLVPVEPIGITLLLADAVVLVEYLPQSLKVALGRVVVFILVDT